LRPSGPIKDGGPMPALDSSIIADAQAAKPQSNNKSSLLLRVLLLLMLSALLPFSTARASDSISNALLQSLVEQRWSEYKQSRGIDAGGMAVNIITPNAQYFAHSGFNRTPEPGATHFRGASTTKTFTAAAILLLHQQGVLNIDDTIDGFFPGTRVTYVPATANYDIPYKSQITIRQLLGHRAGVFDVTNSAIPATAKAPYAGQLYLEYVTKILGQTEHTFTFDELVGVVAANQLSYFKPGAGYHYSNTGYSILGKIIERASGLSYAEFIQQNFLIPNGLDKTSFPYLGSDMDLPSPYADGYSFEGGQVNETTLSNMSGNTAEGNIITTPDDLAKWVRLLFSGRAGLNQETIAMMTDVQETGQHGGNYGLGCNYAAGLGYGHNGAHEGYLTLMQYNPENGVAIVIFCSVIDFEGLGGQLGLLYDVGRAAVSMLVSHPAR
jgi:D-alanyl-D-alanine carboxypeptidase